LGERAKKYNTNYRFYSVSKIFDASKKHELESEFRRKILPVKPLTDLISKIPEGERNVAIDVGSGTGYFAVELAKYYRKVYGIEISEEMAECLRERQEKENVGNIGIIISGEPPELDFSADLVLFSNVLHEMDSPEEYIRWSPSDFVIVIDWKDMKLDFGPKEKIPEEKMEEMLLDAGFETEKVNAYQYHYFIVGKR